MTLKSELRKQVLDINDVLTKELMVYHRSMKDQIHDMYSKINYLEELIEKL